jgi:hypothetical protein
VSHTLHFTILAGWLSPSTGAGRGRVYTDETDFVLNYGFIKAETGDKTLQRWHTFVYRKSLVSEMKKVYTGYLLPLSEFQEIA